MSWAVFFLMELLGTLKMIKKNYRPMLKHLIKKTTRISNKKY